MEKVTYRFTLDTHKNGIQRTLQGFQTGDNMSRQLEISLKENGEPYDIPLDGVVAVMYSKRPSQSNPSINSCTIINNVIRYEVPSTDLTEEGMVQYQLKLISGTIEQTESVLVSPKFEAEVWESEAQDSSAEDTPTYTALEEALIKAQAVYNSRITSFMFNYDIPDYSGDHPYELTVVYGYDDEEEVQITYVTDVFEAATEAIIEEVEQRTDVSGKMDKNNPTGTGSLSINRRSGTTVGNYSSALGYEATASGDYSYAEGHQARAYGENSHAEGYSTEAAGYSSHAEGAGGKQTSRPSVTITTGRDLGNNTMECTLSATSPAFRVGCVIEYNDRYYPVVAVSETTIVIKYAESPSAAPQGTLTPYSVIFARGIATGDYSHAECYSSAYGLYSHSEGDSSWAFGNSSHAEGYCTAAASDFQHVAGTYNEIDYSKKYARITGNGSSDSDRSNAETLDWEGNLKVAGEIEDGFGNKLSEAGGGSDKMDKNNPTGTGYVALGKNAEANYYFGFDSYAIGTEAKALGPYAHVFGNYAAAIDEQTVIGNYNTPDPNASVIIGGGRGGNRRNLLAFNKDNFKATFYADVIDGSGNVLSGKMDKNNPTGTGSFSLNRKSNSTVGYNSFAEGNGNIASGSSSHAEGDDTTASGDYSHAEGCHTSATYMYSHAEGCLSTASGNASHAEGNYTVASGTYAHAEGGWTEATANCSHAEGDNTVASGQGSHAQNQGTIASGTNQTAMGKYNTPISDAAGGAALIIGNGTNDNDRSNALEVDWDGNLKAYGEIVDGDGIELSTRMDRNNPDGTGNMSMNRLEGSTAGLRSATFNGGFETRTISSDSPHLHFLSEDANHLATFNCVGSNRVSTATKQILHFDDGTDTHALPIVSETWDNENMVYLLVLDNSVDLDAFSSSLDYVCLSTDIWYDNIASGEASVAFGKGNTASGYNSAAFGLGNTVFANQGASFGNQNKVYGTNNVAAGVLNELTMASGSSLAVGTGNTATANNVFVGGSHSEAKANCAFAQGDTCVASGTNSFAIGYHTSATKNQSVAMGNYCTASQNNAVALGNYTTASGYHSFAEGERGTASGTGSHKEGSYSTASGNYSHAEGMSCIASGEASHAQGNHAEAKKSNAFASGYYVTADSANQTALGRFNTIDNADTYALIVGNGSTNGRSNAATLDWSGNLLTSGNITDGSGNVLANKMDIPALPSSDGTYTLQVTISNGTPTFSWV